MMVGWKQFVSVLLLASSTTSTLGWTWRTSDAIIQDVWPENQEKVKRASSASTSTKNSIKQPKTSAQDDDSETLIFEGRYFKPNEVPPPPPFMVANNNWRGRTSSTPKPKQALSKSSSSFYYVAALGTGSRVPLPQKFTYENVKDSRESNKTKVESFTLADQRNFSSKSKNAMIASSPTSQYLDDLPYTEELSITEDIFHAAPKCFTATDTQGRCLPFRQCYPVVFNVIDGDLRNPGLAKLLYQSSGPCNATLELDFALSKMKGDKAFYNAEFYNQSICCPGFKHPPTLLRSWDDEVRNTRLTSPEKPKAQLSSTRVPILLSNASRTSVSVAAAPAENEKYASTEIAAVNPNRPPPLAMDDSSVETSENSSAEDTMDGVVRNDLGEQNVNKSEEEEEDEEEDEITLIFENANVRKITNNNATAKEDAKGELFKEERRGDKDKEVSASSDVSTKSTNALLSIPAPNLSPEKCRHQIYGMPRGHWPWMVALVIRSRHICSGALIDERHVITAAHCVFLLDNAEVKKLRIIIGDRVMYSSVDGPHFWRKVEKIITHVNYNQQTFASDIAILKMNSDVTFSRNIQPITISDSMSPVDSGTFSKGIVAGWSGADIGQSAFEARAESETVVDIMDKVDCRNVYRGFALSAIATNTFCIKATNNTCVADSGAPLIIRLRNCWVLAGLMSWGLGCSHFPEVYTDVTRYTSWIRKHTV